MTCRIERYVIAADAVFLRISGGLTGEDVNILRALMEQEKGVLTIDLKDVRSVDDEAVKLLALYESNGAKINNCALYIREWIRRVSEATKG